jgi:tRNA (cytidine/uridine-2'-O-)-methyltransferase
MALHIVLVEPEIPPNTGNISRTCAATGTFLHLVKPLGFSIDDKQLKRAGLDYWPFVKLFMHESLDAFLGEYGSERMFLASTKGEKLYTEPSYQDGDMLVFGKETAGLPHDFIARRKQNTIRIPLSEDTRLRSLNLSNSVGIVLYEALRQLSFPKLK